MELTEMGTLKIDNKWSVVLTAKLDVKIYRQSSVIRNHPAVVAWW